MPRRETMKLPGAVSATWMPGTARRRSGRVRAPEDRTARESRVVIVAGAERTLSVVREAAVVLPMVSTRSRPRSSSRESWAAPSPTRAGASD
jgi:hypothetical protein